MDQLLLGQGGRSSFALGNPQTPRTTGTGIIPLSGAAAAAGVLTAVDEDAEGDDEATVPEPFDYFSDGIDDDEEEGGGDEE